MATLDILSGPDGPLTRLSVPLKGMQPVRSFYALPRFVKAVNDELPGWVTGRLEASQTPQEQFALVLRRWTGNRPRLEYQKHFNDLMPGTDEVWEIKTADLRFFGWVYRPCIFIAVVLGYADWYKPPDRKESYEDARKAVLKERESLNIDPNADGLKFTRGTFDALVGI
jgi:hypothetical protein